MNYENLKNEIKRYAHNLSLDNKVNFIDDIRKNGGM